MDTFRALQVTLQSLSCTPSLFVLPLLSLPVHNSISFTISYLRLQPTTCSGTLKDVEFRGHRFSSEMDVVGEQLLTFSFQPQASDEVKCDWGIGGWPNRRCLVFVIVFVVGALSQSREGLHESRCVSLFLYPCGVRFL